MSKNYEHLKRANALRKDRILYVMGEKCCICGYNKCKAALDLHHINPDEKEFSLSNQCSISWEKTVNELKKCVLVCANCHREIHYGDFNQQLISTFNEDKANEVTTEINCLKNKKHYYCRNCGKEISYQRTYCVECAGLQHRKAIRPEREDFKQMIRTMPFTMIAKEYNVSDNAIRKWCDSYNLPRRKADINNFTDEEWENI